MVDTAADATSLSPWWRHSAILVMIAGFSVLSYVTVLTYTNAPPIPEQAADVTGTVVFTGADIQMGQEVFLKYGLMEHGTLWGHGAYLGPDYSAEYLHRLSEVTRDTIATEKYGKLFAQLSPDEQSVASARTMTTQKVHLLPHGRGCLELRRRRGLRFPDQPADRVLLRGGHVAHRQSRTRRTVWCLWDVGPRGPGLLLEGHAIRHHMEGDGEVRPGGLLGG